jgi:hypothetical protein
MNATGGNFAAMMSIAAYQEKTTAQQMLTVVTGSGAKTTSARPGLEDAPRMTTVQAARFATRTPTTASNMRPKQGASYLFFDFQIIIHDGNIRASRNTN